MQFSKLSDYSKETKAHGLAWMLLSTTIGIHVFDEAIHDYLSFYNPIVNSIQQSVPFLPLPTFTYGAWLAGLIVGIIVLLCLSPLVFRGNRWMFLVSYILGTIMILNAVVHMTGSVIMGRPMAGVYSSFILLAAAVFLIINARKHQVKLRTY